MGVWGELGPMISPELVPAGRSGGGKSRQGWTMRAEITECGGGTGSQRGYGLVTVTLHLPAYQTGVWPELILDLTVVSLFSIFFQRSGWNALVAFGGWVTFSS